MRRAIAVATALTLAAIFAGPASAQAIAYRTGRMETGQLGGILIYHCEYHYMGQKIWMSFRKFCPFQVEMDL